MPAEDMRLLDQELLLLTLLLTAQKQQELHVCDSPLPPSPMQQCGGAQVDAVRAVSVPHRQGRSS